MAKTILAINECDFGSTGKIAVEILKRAKQSGYKCFFAVFRSKGLFENEYLIRGSKIYNFINRLLCRIDGSDGFHNKTITRKLIKWIEHIKPDIISLHNLHGHYINIPILFNYCKQHSVKILWTLHDCWVFTGRCAHFELCDCYKWKNCCGNCPSRKDYPASYLLDGSKKYLQKKYEAIIGLRDSLTLICPSSWLFNYVKQSKLSNFNTILINNGVPSANKIDDSMKENLKLKYGLLNKKVFFFASSGYSKRKGVEYVNKLAEELDNNRFVFIVAGIEEKKSKLLSKKIINVGHVSNKFEMDLYFSIADAFINPTLEDNFPTVNLESLSNGTPVITFNTGGSPETIDDKTGIIVEKGNYEALKTAVLNYDIDRYKQSDCILRSKLLSSENMANNYFKVIENNIKKTL